MGVVENTCEIPSKQWSGEMRVVAFGLRTSVLTSMLLAVQLAFGQLAPNALKGVLQDDRIDVLRDGQLVTSYVFRSGSKPVLWPIHGPDGHRMTRSYPMDATVPDEAHDHPHHRGLWMTFGEVAGADWWAEGKGKGLVAHRKVLSLNDSGPTITWVAQHEWFKTSNSGAADGSAVLLETCRYSVSAMESQTVIDCEYLWKGGDGKQAVAFGDTKEGMFAIRVPETMRGDKPGGEILNSAGDRQGDTWGKSAKWVDYSGPVAPKSGDSKNLPGIYGIAILTHPASFRADGLWHVRTYGLFAHNPFGIKDFLGQRTKTGSTALDPKHSGGYSLPPGESLHFLYRVVFHRDRWDVATGDKEWAAFSETKPQLDSSKKGEGIGL